MTRFDGLPDDGGQREGTLIVVRTLVDAGDAGVERFLVLADDGSITAFNGHVDLGTGIRTALAQIVAEELDVAPDRVSLVLGDTASTPDQGPTIASETIQVAAVPLRRAAAQARRFLLELAATRFARRVSDLGTGDGLSIIDVKSGETVVRFEALLTGRRDRLELAEDVPVKAVADYRVVGRSVRRVDIPAKATGQWEYVHDVRLPGMLHGRVVRPPYAGMDSGDFVGTSLLSVDDASVTNLPGVVAVVVIRDFVGVVAEREEQAIAAAHVLRVTWKPGPQMPDLADLQTALSARPSRPRTLRDTGEVGPRAEAAATRLTRTYVWPYQMHGSIGPSCAVADFQEQRLTVWSGTQNPRPLRADLALLLGVPESRIEVVRLEASGCYGRNCADDVAADAALLARAVGRPVRVQLSREQEHSWEPKGAAQLMQVDGGLTAAGEVAAYDFSTCYPSNTAPSLALLLTGTIAPVAAVSDMGDRTAIPPYRFEHLRVVVNDMAPIVRASWLRGVSALPNTFAHESYVDELAATALEDPVEFRLRHLDDARAIALIRSVAKEAGWQPRTGPRKVVAGEGVLRGQGVAYAQYLHGEFPGTAAAWSAWVAEVEVDRATGEVRVTRVVVGQDSGLVINPAGVRHQIHGNVIQSVSRTLKERVSFDSTAVTTREWGAYPILTFPEVPVIQVVMVAQPNEPPLGAGESASVPSAAAIANAIFDATGVRLREPPFTAEKVRAALYGSGEAPTPVLPRVPLALGPPFSRLKRLGGLLKRRSGWVGAIAGVGVAALTLRTAMAPISVPDPRVYSTETIARGAQLAALGACAVCHTVPGGVRNAGGRPLQTPFGRVYSTNITPDADTGIGAWSYPAFERAMREGIHRDGRRLYPAFPYPSFTKTSEADLQALYAYLLAQTPVRSEVPETRLKFPFSWRPLVAVWNALFLRAGEFTPEPTRSAQWNRGAYLVEGLGHCGGCHSPRNLLGAERSGAQRLAGGNADGWDAPALTALSMAPVPWTESEFYRYLKHGTTEFHGAAAGPMAPVVAGLAVLPDPDVRAMAHYLASAFPASTRDPLEIVRTLAARDAARVPVGFEAGERIFQGACASCHDPVAGTLTGLRPSLAFNSNLHSPRPHNVLRSIVDGVGIPDLGEQEEMPAFRDSLDDRQLSELVRYLRVRFAPDQPAWSNLTAAAAEMRAFGQPP